MKQLDDDEYDQIRYKKPDAMNHMISSKSSILSLGTATSESCDEKTKAQIELHEYFFANSSSFQWSVRECTP